MKTNAKLYMLLLCGILCMAGWGNNVFGQIYKKNFELKYPNARDVEWEAKADYYEVEFKWNGHNMTAYFDKKGLWQSTETEVRFKELPNAVKQAVKTSDYADWKTDDIDLVEKADGTSYYEIEFELEEGGMEQNAILRITSEGEIIE